MRAVPYLLPNPGKLGGRAAFCAGLLLAVVLHAMTYFLGWHEIWAIPVVLIAVTLTAVFINGMLSAAGMFCWANIFVGILSLFHLGYYIPARLGWIAELSFMPAVAGPTTATAMTLYVAAVLAFVTGAAGAALTPRRQASVTSDLEVRVLSVSGLLLSLVSVLLIAVFLAQVGGPLSLFRMSYIEIFSFLVAGDSRFALTGIGLLSTGLLLSYASARLSPERKHRAAWIAVGIWIVAMIQVALGSRGSALLCLLGWMYFRHHLQKKWRPFSLALLLTAILFAIPVVRSYRNFPSGERWAAAQEAVLSPLAAVTEMGLTYRPFYGLTDVFASSGEPLMFGQSYEKAAWHLVPNLGRSSATLPGEYFRTTFWINEQLDPISAAQNIGMGSSGIGEPYANFGYPGVVALFLGLGFFTTSLELRALGGRSARALGYLVIVFVPLCWYVRDDVYSTLRAIIWPLWLLVGVRGVLQAIRPRLCCGPLFARAAGRF